MAFRVLIAVLLAMLLSSCCCFGGSVDRPDTDLVNWDGHDQGNGNGI
jgi:hypothetical protein